MVVIWERIGRCGGDGGVVRGVVVGMVCGGSGGSGGSVVVVWVWVVVVVVCGEGVVGVGVI